MITKLDVWDASLLLSHLANLKSSGKGRRKRQIGSSLRKAVDVHIKSIWEGLGDKEKRKALSMCHYVGILPPNADLLPEVGDVGCVVDNRSDDYLPHSYYGSH